MCCDVEGWTRGGLGRVHVAVRYWWTRPFWVGCQHASFIDGCRGSLDLDLVLVINCSCLRVELVWVLRDWDTGIGAH